MLIFEDPAVRFQNVTKTWGTQTILDDVTFDIPKGKIVTILGFSGAGKSTLLKHILGITRPTKGSIEVLGEDLASMEWNEFRDFRRNFGMLFQYAALFDSITTLENVTFPMRELTDMPEGEILARAEQLLASVGIEDISFNKMPSQLSGGMRKRVGLARAMALEPKIMLYDEPTTGLDPIMVKRVNKLILETAQSGKNRGMTSIIISHDVRTSLEISDFIAFLNHGNIVEYLPASGFAGSSNEAIQEFIGL